MCKRDEHLDQLGLDGKKNCNLLPKTWSSIENDDVTKNTSTMRWCAPVVTTEKLKMADKGL